MGTFTQGGAHLPDGGGQIREELQVAMLLNLVSSFRTNELMADCKVVFIISNDVFMFIVADPFLDPTKAVMRSSVFSY